MHLWNKMEEVAKREYEYTPEDIKKPKIITFKEIKNDLESAGLKYVKYKIIVFEKSAEEQYEFAKIPIMTERIFPKLNYRQRMEILDKAYAECDKVPMKHAWIYFAVEK